jgi:hypothetical protein
MNRGITTRQTGQISKNSSPATEIFSFEMQSAEIALAGKEIFKFTGSVAQNFRASISVLQPYTGSRLGGYSARDM